MEIPPDDTPLRTLPFSTRVRHCLIVAGLERVGDVRARPYSALMAIPNFGQGALLEVVACLGDWDGAGFDVEAIRHPPPERDEAAALAAARAERRAAYRAFIDASDRMRGLQIAVKLRRLREQAAREQAWREALGADPS